MPQRLAHKPPKTTDRGTSEHAVKGTGPIVLMSVESAAAFALVSQITVRRWIKAKLIRRYKAGHQIRIDQADLVEFLSRA
jgi:excisionase family DNA binding protein